MADAVSQPLSASETLAGTPAPLTLGDPAAPVLELAGGPVPDAQVDVSTVWRTVRLGPEGVGLVVDWLTRWLEFHSREEAATGSEVELWTASGIAQEESVGRRTVYEWIERPDFPAPFAHPVGGAPVYEASRVRAWSATRRRRPGPRPKAIRP